MRIGTIFVFSINNIVPRAHGPNECRSTNLNTFHARPSIPIDDAFEDVPIRHVADVLRQFVSISDATCFKTHSPWLLAFRQSGYALLTARPRQEIPATPYPNTQVPWGITPVANGEL